jgi:hypothetical protein
MSTRAGAARERMFELLTPDVVDAPVRATPPHFNVSPRTPTGAPTQGIALTFIAPQGAAAVGSGEGASGGASGPGGGFQVTLWRAVPITGGWASLAPFTTNVVYGEQYVIEDISGAWGIYVQIGGVTVDGAVLVAIAELE